MNLAGQLISLFQDRRLPGGFCQSSQMNGQTGLGRLGSGDFKFLWVKIAHVRKPKGQTTNSLAARYQGNHKHCFYAESQQIGALVLKNCRLGIADALYGNRLVKTVVEASVIKRPRLPSFRISGLSRRHHSAVLEEKFEAQNVFFDVTQSQSGRDSAELARDGSRYLSEELIEFGHRGEGVNASAKC